ncbi:hypothetical protein BC629DRAFT_1714864 [Irpex lacteus]|nr:hypothetical protein BC629DRAFT_1714864 [Irpex lacteus]
MSSSNSRTWSALTIAGVTIASGVLAYAVYFDYKRRNDADFRKKLRKEKKRVQKAAAAAKPSVNVSADELRAAIAKIRSEEIPEIGPEREAYFMQNVGIGEQLCTQGPVAALPAAMSFFRALRVYPSPVELIMIYQKTVPEEVFQLIVEMTNLDEVVKQEEKEEEQPKLAADSQEEDEAPETSPERSGPPSETSSQDWDRLTDTGSYYDFFPAKAFNVSVQDRDNKKILVADKDFETGDVIYTEKPVVAALDPDLQEAGTHCTHCFRLVHQADAVSSDKDPLHASLLPPEIDQSQSTSNAEARHEGQQAFVKYLKESKKTHPLLVARFAARQIATEIAKLTEQVTKQTDDNLDLPGYVEKGGPEYALGDHFERLRYVDAPVPEEETKVIQGVFSNSLPGLDEFLTDERHAIMLSKVAHNAIGIAFSGGRDDRPVFHERPEDQERTRTPYGTSQRHSELHLVATRPIKKGDELTMSYVDVTQHENESPDEARRRRRFELARGWRSKCCSGKLGVEKDESRLEASVERFVSGRA